MYMGKAAMLAKKQAKQKKSEMAKVQMQKNELKIKQLYGKFQSNINEFAKKHKHEINSDSKFRQKFSQMCQEFDVNPMLAQKNIWTQLGLGDFYHHLAMKILDICAKNRHKNGGIMKIQEIVAIYKQKEKTDISRNDVLSAMGKTNILGNASIINKEYVCTVPIQLNNNLTQLLGIAQKFGFISAKLLKKQKNWTQEEFQKRILDLRKKGVLWIDKKVPHGPHYYFLSQLGSDFRAFSSLMQQF